MKGLITFVVLLALSAPTLMADVIMRFFAQTITNRYLSGPAFMH